MVKTGNTETDDVRESEIDDEGETVTDDVVKIEMEDVGQTEMDDVVKTETDDVGETEPDDVDETVKNNVVESEMNHVGETATDDEDSTDDISDFKNIEYTQNTITPRTEISKHRNNIKEILDNSNATPIRRYGGIGYTCCYCEEQYENPAHLKTHTLDTHKDVTQANFMKSMNMSEYVVKLDITDLKCKLCEKEMRNLNDFTDHLQKTHEKKILAEYNSHIFPIKFSNDLAGCALCANVFSRFRMLVRHMHLHYRNYICTVCDAGFVNRNSWTQHTLNHKTGTHQCEYCPKVFSTLVKKRLHERTGHTHVEETYKCGYCIETFKDYRKKELHVSSVHGVALQTPVCQACHKEFKTRKALNIHVKKDHLMERLHKCKDCDMTFYSSTGLKNHVVKHTGSKEFQCTVCLKSYARKKTLNAHMLIHEVEKRFKCEQCKQDFTQKCSWRTHMRNKHGEIV